MNTVELTLPAWMASPLINGDYSSLDESTIGGREDQEKIDKLEKWLEEQKLGGALSCSEESHFLNSPPFDARHAYGETLGGDYLDFTFPELTN